MGIGLTIVRSLAELHGGTVSATSEGPNQGSEFIVRLPVAVESSNSISNPRVVASETPRRVARVLVVDDNVDTAQGMGRILKLLGHQVEIAHDGPTAIALAQKHQPEFVLLDIGLPGMDGYQVATRLKAEDWCRKCVIIAVSGYGQEDDRRRAREAGFDHHLVKPVDHESLLGLLARG
ncbi:MAG: hypothetical protein NVSMB14_13170 [Isosphaeraceae bacterium]